MAERGKARILLLTQPGCAYCDLARDVIDHLALEFPLDITTESLGSPRGRELAKDGNMLFAPAVFVNEQPFGYGRLSERKLRRELKHRLADA